MHWQIGEYSNLWAIFEVLNTGRKSYPGQGLIDARWNKATNCPLRRGALNPCMMWSHEAYSIGIPGEVSATRISTTYTSTLIWKIGIKFNYKILWSKIFHEQQPLFANFDVRWWVRSWFGLVVKTYKILKELYKTKGKNIVCVLS